MHLHFEEPSSQLRCDSVINSLSWMGRVPDEQPEGHGWKLNRTSYYQEGWLAAGNNRSVVGVTFTSTLPHRNSSINPPTENEISGSNLPLPSAPPHLPLPPRTNYNLRGHRAQISLVRWNEPYQKLATCDASGIIFVWIRYEGRWSIELINDRNTPVTHFSWSHDGRMAVIAYQDGFVLVGSVAGQRYWSTVLNQESIITTGTWTPDDQQVYLGTSSGSIVVLDVHNGAVIAQIQMSEPSSLSPGSVSSGGSTSAANGIRQLAWNCPRFKMEEPSSSTAAMTSNSTGRQTGAPTDGHLLSSLSGGVEDQHHVLAVLTAGGRLSLIKGFDDVHPCSALDEDDEDEGRNQQRTSGSYCSKGRDDPCWNKGPLSSPMMEWNNDGELLCLGGHHHIQSSSSTALHHYANILQFYNSRGVLRFRIAVPYTQAPITSFTWGHNDRRLFVATGCTVHVAWVSPRRIASLQHLARLKLRRCLTGPDQLDEATFADRVPRLIRNLVVSLFSSTVHCHVPEEHRIRDYVCRPPPGNTRLYCTMIRRDDEDSSAAGCHGVDGLIDPIDPAAAAAMGGSSGGGVGFTLYLEFLGGLIPLLKGKPTSRIRPEFVIYDPRKIANNETNKVQPLANKNSELFLAPPQPSGNKFQQLLSPGLRRKFRRHRPDNDSDSETDDSCVSTPRLQRKFGGKKQLNQSVNPQNSGDINESKTSGQEQSTLAEVASNIWGTRFKITGIAPSLPAHLGQITYKTSLLHLQPRQMTLGVVDLRDSSSGAEIDDEESGSSVFICPSDDEEHAKANREPSNRQHPPIVPLTTPNLRLRRKAGRNRMEPPPSPTHHRRPVQQQQHQSTLDEMLRIEWNNQSESRIVLSTPAVRWRSQSAGHLATVNSSVNNRPSGRRRKSRSLDSSPVLGSNRSGGPGLSGVRSSWAVQITQPAIPKGLTTDKKTNTNSFRSRVGSQVLQVQHVSDSESNNKVNKEKRFALARLSPLFGRKCPSSAGKSKAGRSEPNTPNPSPSVGRRRNNSSATAKNERRHQSPIRQLLNSPLLARRLGKNRFAPPAATAMTMDSSDDDIDDPQATTVHNFHDLESFQKAQLLNKLRQTWIAEKNAATANKVEEREPPTQTKRRCEFVLNNKAPLWNEHSQVYQLDFGGRVTQESAKNFQIEFKGKQVMQFGRIDGNAYTLDFQYPFSAVQAFAVALANVTQRLK